MKRIPSKITIGGQDVEIRNVVRCDGNAVGECHLLEGYIEIAEIFNKDQVQSESSKVIMTRNDLIDKEVAEKLSKEVVSYIIEQVTKNERN